MYEDLQQKLRIEKILLINFLLLYTQQQKCKMCIKIKVNTTELQRNNLMRLKTNMPLIECVDYKFG